MSTPSSNAESLNGQVAVVTAGANGIGEGSAMALAGLGADIVIGDIDKENGARVVKQVEALGRKAAFLEANFLDPEQGAALVAFAKETFGRVDILVNNAGGVKQRNLVDQTTGNWRRVMDLNFVSMVSATQEFARIAEPGGAIVNVASSEGYRAAPGYSVYAACKAAMISFTKTMALELAPQKIRVNCIAPDNIASPGLAGLMDSDSYAHVPLARMASIEEAGAVVAFLASPMSSFVTGTSLPVDGGITASSGWHLDSTKTWRQTPE